MEYVVYDSVPYCNMHNSGKCSGVTRGAEMLCNSKEKVIADLKKNYHIAIAMVSHDLGIVKEYADNVILINKSVLKSGSAEEVFSSPEFKESFFHGLD
mgnify:CR=1 FL=1